MPTADEVFPYPPRPEECLHAPNGASISKLPLRKGNRNPKIHSRSAFVYTVLILVPLLLLFTFSLVRVERPAIERIAIPTAASGVVYGVLGRVTGMVTGDATDDVTENTAMMRFVRNVTGAGTIDVARTAAAG